MNTSTTRAALLAAAIFVLVACAKEPAAPGQEELSAPEGAQLAPIRNDIYSTVALTADIGQLSDNQREIIRLGIAAAEVMDELFWEQAFGPRASLLDRADLPEPARRFAAVNYGPWDRLAGDAPFLEGFGEKPKGANFYPPDMTIAEFESSADPGKASLYTLVRRNDAGELVSIPYREAYRGRLERAAALVRQAADLAEDPGLARYLALRADALLTDDFDASDRAWLDMKDNALDLVIGPIENYEDQLFGYKTAYEAYVLVKDLEWSARLSRYANFLPELQSGLPVEQRYKAEEPGTDADLNAYDVVYYAGHSNAGSKTIAINLPNDETIQLEKGTRRLQLKNAMRAKFDRILVPIADVLLHPDQRDFITFDAFFANTMFHEVAHGLGIKRVLGTGEPVRTSLKETASSVEEGKADVLGLYMITRLHEQGELGDVDLRDYYVTFMASIFRSIRFGASSAHGKANMVRFNFFIDRGALVRDDEGLYRIDMDRMGAAMNELSALILELQGDGDYAGAKKLTEELGTIRPQLAKDLDRLTAAEVPVDIVFEQGLATLGL